MLGALPGGSTQFPAEANMWRGSSAAPTLAEADSHSLLPA